MKDQTGIDRLIEFESACSEILMAFKVDGMHLWPAIRTKFMMEIRQKIEGKQQAHAGNLTNWLSNISIRKIGKFFEKKYIPHFNVPKVDAVFLTAAIRRNKQRNGLFFDASYDYFGQDNGFRSLFLEEPFQVKHFPPEFSSEIRYLDIMKVQTRLQGLLHKRKFQEQTQGLIEALTSQAEKYFPSFHDIPRMLSGYPMYLVRSFYYAESLNKIILQTGARMVSLHCCGYGGFRSFLAKKLKDRGIAVVEFQHGAVGEEHPAYNYSSRCPFYREYLPDFFLTYGEYWSNKSGGYPPKKVIIGNPTLEEERLKFQIQGNLRNKKILIVSQGTMTDDFVGLAKKLRTLLPEDYSITFRLHPGEVPFRKDRCEVIESIPGIAIQDKGDIYSSLSDHEIIVGAYSTTIFEALPFRKRIFVLDCNISRRFIPSEIGQWFNGAEDLGDMILSGKEQKRVNCEYYWAENWKKCFQRFLINIQLLPCSKF